MPGSSVKTGEIYTAENITDSYKRSIYVAGSQSVYTPTFNRLLSQGFQNQFQDNTTIPALTSTPNVQRQEDVNDDNMRASKNACWLINRIEQLDNGIKAIKRDVIQQMEYKINELKSSLIAMIEKLNTNTTYADAIRSPRPASSTEEPSLEIGRNTVDSCYIDEGYGDQSGMGVQRASSETLLKTPFVANDRENRNLQPAETTNIRARHTQQHAPARTTQYEAPVLTQNQAPAMTQHQAPAMTQHLAPALTQHHTPALTQYPAMTQHQAPAMTQHQAPALTQHQAPELNQHQTPVLTQHQAPAMTQHQPIFQQHVSDKSTEQDAVTTTGQQIPVIVNQQPVTSRVTNRNLQNQSRPIINRNIFTSPPTSQNKTLIVGDSILNGINYRGLRKDVKICSRSGASIDDLWEEISIYDMKSFARIIICIGGNDCSRKRNTSDFEDSYDQLIGFIKSVNQGCSVYLSKIVPRGDVDVSAFNASIRRVLDHWAKHKVYCIDESYEMFFGRDRMPMSRYFSEDGIHLSHSGTKRLLDAWNKHITIVKDYDQCVYQASRYPRKTYRPGTNMINSYERQADNSTGNYRYNGPRRNDTRRCYGCNIQGHILAECWNSQ